MSSEVKPSPTPEPDDIKSMKFEQALHELRALVQKIEQGEVSLEDSVAAFERGSLLKRRCESLLLEAQMRIQKVEKDGRLKEISPNALGRDSENS